MALSRLAGFAHGIYQSHRMRNGVQCGVPYNACILQYSILEGTMRGKMRGLQLFAVSGFTCLLDCCACSIRAVLLPG